MASDHQFLNQDVRLCMSLAKFSHANAPVGNLGPIPWNHISSQNDLYALIDPYETSSQLATRETRYKFRVLRDPNVLVTLSSASTYKAWIVNKSQEDVDLHLLACEARRAIDEAQRSTMVRQQPPITIIVKSPCIAMRYPLRDRQVRFSNQEDFQKTLKVFTSMMIPYVEAGNLPPAQPIVAPQNEQIAALETRLNYGNPYGSTVQENQRPALQEHISNTASMAFRPVSQTSDNTAFIPMPASQPYFQVPTLASQPSSHNRNTIADAQSLIATPFFQAHHLSNGSFASNSQGNDMRPFDSEFAISTYTPRPSTAPVATKRSVNFELPPKRDLPFARKNKALVSTASEVAFENIEDVHETNITATGLERESSDTIKDPSTEQKRDITVTKRATTSSKKKLAAKKPRARASRSKIIEKRLPELLPAPSAEQLPLQDTAQQLKPITDQSHVDPNEAVVINRPAQLDTQEQESAASATESQSRHDSIAKVKAARSSNHAVAEIPTDSSTKQTGSTHHLRSRKVAKGQPNQSDEASRLIQQTTSAPPAHSANGQNQPQPQHYQSALEALLNDPDFAKVIPLATHSKSNITDFDTLPEEQRHEALESWMVQNLEDPNFLRLCKTLEGVWQRIFVKI